MPTETAPTVLIRRQGRIGRITLDRPRALHALDLGMVRTIRAALDGWAHDPAVHAVVVDATGDRAFCAGGDIRAIRQSVMDRDRDAVEAFFSEEYAMNGVIAAYPKPYVSLIDGICMGGGIGLSVHGSIRAASEAAMFAMPETAIALFPDVGATFVLPRLRGHYGMYMALTGARATAADAAWLGLTTHVVPRAAMAGLADAIAQDGIGAVAERAVPPGEPPMAALDVSAFSAGSVDAILAALAAQGGEWAEATIATLRHASPSAVLWAFEAVRRGATQTLPDCLAMELALTRTVTVHPDFAEGVRAMVVDKDRTPRWSPARLEDVPPAATAAVFA